MQTNIYFFEFDVRILGIPVDAFARCGLTDLFFLPARHDVLIDQERNPEIPAKLMGRVS